MMSRQLVFQKESAGQAMVMQNTHPGYFSPRAPTTEFAQSWFCALNPKNKHMDYIIPTARGY
jgi:hypothetical protein